MNRKKRMMGSWVMMLLLVFYVAPWTATTGRGSGLLVRASTGEITIVDREKDMKISISVGGISKEQNIRYLVDFTKYVLEESALSQLFKSVKDNLDYFDQQVENLFRNAKSLMGVSHDQEIRKAT